MIPFQSMTKVFAHLGTSVNTTLPPRVVLGVDKVSGFDTLPMHMNQDCDYPLGLLI